MDNHDVTTLELEEICRSVPSFLGAFALDQLPLSVRLPASLIVNTDPSDRSGQHWLAIWINRNGYGEYFDSLGFMPMHEEIYRFLGENTRQWVYSDQPVQPRIRESRACGKYCALFILARNEGWTFKEFQRMFTTDARFNDHLASGLLALHTLYDRLAMRN